MRAVFLLWLLTSLSDAGVVLQGDFKPCGLVSSYLFCDGNVLGTDFPTIIPGSSTIVTFRITGSSVDSIPANAFANLTALNEFKMDQSTNLKRVDPAAFNGLTELRRLELSNRALVSSTHSIDLASIVSSAKRLEVIEIAHVKLEAINRLSGSVENMTLTNTGLTQVISDAFKEATKLKKLDISTASLNGSLTWLSQLDSLTHLRLTACALRYFTIPQRTNKLQTLILSRNVIDTVGTSSFGGSLKVLKNLDLSSNQIIKATNLIDLQELSALESLSLTRCSSITAVPTFIKNMKSLKILDLSLTKLTKIDQNSFPANKRLQSLNLASNVDIREIHVEAFDDLPNLETLSLSFLQFDLMHLWIGPTKTTQWKALFERVKNVSNIRMQSCRLDNRFWDHLSPLTKVKNMELKGNAFTGIKDFMFAKFTHLIYLGIRDNAIDTLSPKSTYGILKGTTLTLTNNNLTTIDACTFQYIDLEKLSLDDNPLVCDCRLKWLREKMSSLTGTARLQFLKCGPGPHHQKTVISIAASNFQCNASTQIVPCSNIPYTTPEPPLPSINFTFSSTDGRVSLENVALLGRWFTHYRVVYTAVDSPPSYQTKVRPITEATPSLPEMQRGKTYSVCVHLYKLSSNQATVDVSELNSRKICVEHRLDPVASASVAVIIAIVLAVIIVLILLALIIFYFCKRSRDLSMNKYKSEEGIYEDYTYPPSTEVYSTAPTSRPPSRRFVRASDVSHAGTHSTILDNTTSRLDLGQSTISLAVQNRNQQTPTGRNPTRFMSMGNLPTGSYPSAGRPAVSMSMDELNRRQAGPRQPGRAGSTDAALANRRLPIPSEDYTYIEERDQYYDPEEQARYLRMSDSDVDPQYLHMGNGHASAPLPPAPSTVHGTLDEEDSYGVNSGPPVAPRPTGNGSVDRRQPSTARESQQTLINNRQSDDNSAGFENPSLHMSAADLGSF